MGTRQLQAARGKLRGPQLRGLLLLGSIILLVAGLLGMHAMAGSIGGHSMPVAAHASAAHDGATVGASSGAQQVEAAAGASAAQQHAHLATGGLLAGAAAASQKQLQCADACAAAPLGHEHIAVACVLALLSGLLLVSPPRALARDWMPLVPTLFVPDAGSTRIGPPPPSLIQLSISRT